MNQSDTHNDAGLEFDYPDRDNLLIILSGDWLLKNRPPSANVIKQQLDANPALKRIHFDTRHINSWDTGLLIYLSQVIQYSIEKHLHIDRAGLPEGVCSLLDLANVVPAIKHDERHIRQDGLLNQIGNMILDMVHGLPQGLNFIGETLFSFTRLIRGRAQFRISDLFLIIQEVGPNALPIVSLVSFLVGLILAYMGAAQLERVGAQIYIADLVGIGMVREIAALMTGIIMAGRTGAAFAAELGTMQVNEEIDAFKTLGISIMDFLVLPRLLALVLMIPLLTLYSGLVGILAGMFIAIIVFDISAFEYYQQTIRALDMKQYGVGIFKGTCYGVVIAVSGCLRGIQCGRSALAVGRATTSAVVTSIVYIVIVASALTVAFYKLGI